MRHLPLDDRLRLFQLIGCQLRRGNDLGGRANRCKRISQLMRKRRKKFVLASILFAQLTVEHRQLLLIQLLRGNIDRHSVEVRRCAVARIVGSAERADPLDRSRSGMHGAVYDVIGVRLRIDASIASRSECGRLGESVQRNRRS